MSVRKGFKLKSGTELPLMNLRGKEYLQVAHRLIWLVEEVDSYTIETNFLLLTEDAAICRSVITIFDSNGKMLKQASATKKETKKDFADFIEKAETGSCGRALAMLGMGTQFSTQDMEEGDRLADAPLPPKGEQAVVGVSKPVVNKPSGFVRKPKVEEPKVVEEVIETTDDSMDDTPPSDDEWQ